MTPPVASSAAQVQSPAVSVSKSRLISNTSSKSTAKSLDSSVPSLAALWARKYFIAVTTRDDAEQLKQAGSLTEVTSKAGRIQTADKLMQNLTLASAQAWSMTETLLSGEIRRHGINPDLIDPWQIAADSRALFQKALQAYAERVTPHRLSVIVGNEFGRVRQKYTAHDPRAIGFVSMQFHYTGKCLLEWLSLAERSLVTPYLKVMDDHMYMPLRDAYEAAANHAYNSPVLVAVQHLLPVSTKIAQAVCDQVCRLHPGFESHSGSLASKQVKISSIRDVEMFQVYLCLCVLENSIRSVQHELFPLCVMLYPQLKVNWRLVQDMLRTMGWEMHSRLSPEDMATFLPYLRTLTEMFSCEVFQNA
jgi:hypothetical protein